MGWPCALGIGVDNGLVHAAFASRCLKTACVSMLRGRLGID